MNINSDTNEGFVAGCGCLIFIIMFLSPMFFRFPSGGQQKGYISAVDKDIICNTIYIKTDLASSQEDQYDVNSSDNIEDFTKTMEAKTNIVISYNTNTIGYCKYNLKLSK